jgi:hypothetical protein
MSVALEAASPAHLSRNMHCGCTPAAHGCRLLRLAAACFCSAGELSWTKFRNVDTSEFNGLQNTCAGSESPWGTHIGSEENAPNGAPLCCSVTASSLHRQRSESNTVASHSRCLLLCYTDVTCSRRHCCLMSQAARCVPAASLQSERCHTVREPSMCNFYRTACAARALEAGYGFNDTAILPSGTFSGIYSTMRYFGEPLFSADLICTSYV